jgi:uncharacterized membrane protein
MILQLSAGSSGLVRGAAALVLSLHITAATVGILSGATALLARKGSRLHRKAGNWFFVSMLTMSAIGAGVAPFLPDRISTVAAVLTFYLVATAWVTVRRKEGSAGLFEIGSGIVALSIAVAGVTFGLQASNSSTGLIEGQPAGTAFMFAAVAVLAAIGDLSIIARRGGVGVRRIARHLWRMCFALFIAAGSFFLGQQQVFPASMRGSSLLFLPEIAVLGLMIFWLVRVRFTAWIKRVAVERRAIE